MAAPMKAFLPIFDLATAKGLFAGADGNPVPIYSEVQKEGEEFEHAGNIIKDTVPQSQLAILHSWESRWAIWWQPQTDKFDPIAEIIAYYRPLREITQSIDVISPSAPLVQYRVVVAPALTNPLSPEP